MKKDRYFEGWYFKSVDAMEQNAFAVIPGISLSGDKSHSFVQFLDSSARKAVYFRYGRDEFRAEKGRFEVKIGKNFFSGRKMILDAEQDGVKVRADLEFDSIIPWPSTVFSPGAMGWYRFVPAMECYHGVLSFNHCISGYFEVNGIRKDFTGGKGYCEKDWGTSMPSSWIWFQCNHFDNPRASVFGSIARIPWLGSSFTGYLFGFYLDGRIYRFTTYTGARLGGLAANGGKISFHVEDRSYRMEISADRTEGADLPAPSFGEMSSKVNESLNSRVRIVLYGKKEKRVIFMQDGRKAGLEFVGDIKELVKGLG